MRKGKFIVIEGLDGSGKSTQGNLIFDHLKSDGHVVEKIDFPQYGQKSAGLVEEYLNGKYGNVDPYKASIFYACDRYDGSFKIRKWLDEGKIVICDRYVASNMGHQGGKIKDDNERDKYLKWLYNFEYNLLKIPKPDINIILETSVELSMQVSNKISDKKKIKKRELYLGDSEKQDIHEADKDHLKNTLDSYLKLANDYPDEFKIIDCLENGELISIAQVQQKVWAIVKNVL